MSNNREASQEKAQEAQEEAQEKGEEEAKCYNCEGTRQAIKKLDPECQQLAYRSMKTLQSKQPDPLLDYAANINLIMALSDIHPLEYSK